MIAGAVDLNVHPYAYRFMEKLGALRYDCNDDPESILASYDAKRNGTALADGGAILVLETLESALARGADIYCEITGYGANCFGNHICSPDPSGIGNFKATRMALVDADITPHDVDFVNTHATSTKMGDAAEALAMKKVFYNKKIHHDKKALKSIDAASIKEEDLIGTDFKNVAVTAHKGNFGHT